MRVLVIGGGLGGLALAGGLAARGVDVQVHEKDEAVEARFQGYRIGLGDEAWEALRTCLPAASYALAESTSGVLTGPGLLLDDQLTVLARDDAGEFGPPPGSRVVDRHVLRHVLLDGLGDRVRFGARFRRFEERPDGRVRVVFADGTEDTGDVVVGADGSHSAVRGQLRPEVRLVPADLTGALGRTPLTERFRPLVPGRGTMIKGPGVTLMLGRMEFATPPADASPRLPATASYIRWVLLVPPEHPAARADAAPRDAREVVLELVRDWHPEVLELIRQADAHQSAIGRAALLDRPITAWDASRVTLLGDAAHLTVASGGNGANTALRDAAGLVERLTAGTDVVEALRGYREAMLRYGNAAVEHAREKQREFVPGASS